MSPVRLLVSACLLGERVRYDGRDKYDPWLVEKLGRFVEWERVCPEVDGGMPVPRPPMERVGDPPAPSLVAVTGADLTAQLQIFIDRRLGELTSVELCGFVCKKGSPSCGMADVLVRDARGRERDEGAGLFTAAFMERFPLVPVEEEGRLRDPRLRATFLERVFARRRWLDLVAGGRRRGRLVQFHTDQKYLLLAHGRGGYTALGRLVATAKAHRPTALFAAYEEGFTAALARPATVKQVTDVLQHMQGFLKGRLDRGEKAELVASIEAFRAGRVPLAAPRTLLRQHAERHGVTWLARQAFLAPYPEELA